MSRPGRPLEESTPTNGVRGISCVGHKGSVIRKHGEQRFFFFFFRRAMQGGVKRKDPRVPLMV